ncbi:response regulator transcription factor [Actinoplanes couchii]|uniref:Two component transcriptional regulator, LuxR family n=1 Tax=Actinoplanes couchii TaxID=403638 RepID=A0ABQ3X0F0_9ACTN|nr:response regulator transcription factor [Actinoplanes couchii]MDR6316383.1 DNA-binding NarL/FixJ family response regulator [Actinoplanes couchii]GID51997.1 hypothetical protein Aco03nite_004010 [Actinoplanes couchii]
MTETVRVLIADDDPLVRMGLSLVLGADPAIVIVGEAGDGGEAVAMTRELKPDVVLMDVRMPRTDGLAATEELRRDGPSPVIIVLTTFDTDANLIRALRLGANGFLLKDIAPTEIISAVRRGAAGESILAPSLVPRLIDFAVGRAGENAVGSGGESGGGVSGRGASGAGKSRPGESGGGGSGNGESGGGDSGNGESGGGDSGNGERGGGGNGNGESGGGGSRGGVGGGRGGGGAAGGGRSEVEDSRERALRTLGRLSGREREVAEAVATGASNAEIGSVLHMSVPTVKAYVSRVLDKLGCTNRVQVAVLVHESGHRRA